MPQFWIWLQLLIGWLPIGVLFALLVFTAHRNASPHEAMLVAARGLIAGALLSLPVYRLTKRLPWPDSFRLSFLAQHIVWGSIFAVTYVLTNSLIETLFRWRLSVTVGVGFGPFFVVGVWL